MANVPVNKALYSRVKAEAKRKFKVYPSAYANAWLVREYKKRGGTYRTGTKKKWQEVVVDLPDGLKKIGLMLKQGSLVAVKKAKNEVIQLVDLVSVYQIRHLRQQEK